MTKDEIVQQFKRYTKEWDGHLWGDNQRGKKGSVIGCLEAECGGPENRKRILRILTGHTSSKELSDEQWHALHKWVQPWKPEGGQWGSGNIELEKECNILLNADVNQAGQEKMQFDYPELEEIPWDEYVKEVDQEYRNQPKIAPLEMDDWEPPF